MSDEVERHAARQAESVKHSAQALERTAGAVADSADRRTELAADRTVLAGERTYAAWVRTGLAGLASGVGAKALFATALPAWFPAWWGSLVGTAFIAFSIFCYVAAVWREMDPGAPPPKPDTRKLPKGLLLGMNGFLVVIDLAAILGIWTAPR
jgi:putative membrane protein